MTGGRLGDGDDANSDTRRTMLREALLGAGAGVAYAGGTPHLDRLASDGTRFTRAFATLEPAVKYQRIAETKGLPRDSH